MCGCTGNGNFAATPRRAQHLAKARRRHRCTAFSHEHEAAGVVVSLQRTQHAHLFRRRSAAPTGFHSSNVARASRLARNRSDPTRANTPRCCAIRADTSRGSSSHRAVRSDARLLCAVDKPLDFLRCQVLARSSTRVRLQLRRYCPVLKSWRLPRPGFLSLFFMVCVSPSVP